MRDTKLRIRQICSLRDGLFNQGYCQSDLVGARLVLRALQTERCMGLLKMIHRRGLGLHGLKAMSTKMRWLGWWLRGLHLSVPLCAFILLPASYPNAMILIEKPEAEIYLLDLSQSGNFSLPSIRYTHPRSNKTRPAWLEDLDPVAFAHVNNLERFKSRQFFRNIYNARSDILPVEEKKFDEFLHSDSPLGSVREGRYQLSDHSWVVLSGMTGAVDVVLDLSGMIVSKKSDMSDLWLNLKGMHDMSLYNERGVFPIGANRLHALISSYFLFAKIFDLSESEFEANTTKRILASLNSEISERLWRLPKVKVLDLILSFVEPLRSGYFKHNSRLVVEYMVSSLYGMDLQRETIGL